MTLYINGRTRQIMPDTHLKIEKADIEDIRREFSWIEHPGEILLSRAESCEHKTRLYALISTWQEADIIEAAVKNCLAEGCDRVYLLDNASEDNTVELGVAAGAEVAEIYQTEFYRDSLRIRLANRFMKRVTEEEKNAELWWMCLDCDEMPTTAQRTIKESLERLASECNTVGALSLDHFPSSQPANIPGKHPAHLQPLGWLRKYPPSTVCPRGHWKHPLLKTTNGDWWAIFSRGIHAHLIRHGTKLIEPTGAMLLHHFPYRNEKETRARLEKLCAGNVRRSIVDDSLLGDEGAIQRYKHLDAVYRGDWKNVRMPHLQCFRNLERAGAPVADARQILGPAVYDPRIP